MSPVDRLVAESDIRATKSAYLRGLDDKDWTGLRGLLCDDLRFDHPVLGRITGADAVVAAVAARIGGQTSVHHGHDPFVRLTAADRAEGEWSLHSHLFDPAAPEAGVTGFGRYRDVLRKVDGTWRFASIELTYRYKGTLGGATRG
jgi:hypothetical protein